MSDPKKTPAPDLDTCSSDDKLSSQEEEKLLSNKTHTEFETKAMPLDDVDKSVEVEEEKRSGEEAQATSLQVQNDSKFADQVIKSSDDWVKESNVEVMEEEGKIQTCKETQAARGRSQDVGKNAVEVVSKSEGKKQSSDVEVMEIGEEKSCNETQSAPMQTQEGSKNEDQMVATCDEAHTEFVQSQEVSSNADQVVTICKDGLKQSNVEFLEIEQNKQSSDETHTVSVQSHDVGKNIDKVVTSFKEGTKQTGSETQPASCQSQDLGKNTGEVVKCFEDKTKGSDVEVMEVAQENKSTDETQLASVQTQEISKNADQVLTTCGDEIKQSNIPILEVEEKKQSDDETHTAQSQDVRKNAEKIVSNFNDKDSRSDIGIMTAKEVKQHDDDEMQAASLQSQEGNQNADQEERSSDDGIRHSSVEVRDEVKKKQSNNETQVASSQSQKSIKNADEVITSFEYKSKESVVEVLEIGEQNQSVNETNATSRQSQDFDKHLAEVFESVEDKTKKGDVEVIDADKGKKSSYELQVITNCANRMKQSNVQVMEEKEEQQSGIENQASNVQEQEVIETQNKVVTSFKDRCKGSADIEVLEVEEAQQSDNDTQGFRQSQEVSKIVDEVVTTCDDEIKQSISVIELEEQKESGNEEHALTVQSNDVGKNTDNIVSSFTDKSKASDFKVSNREVKEVEKNEGEDAESKKSNSCQTGVDSQTEKQDVSSDYSTAETFIPTSSISIMSLGSIIDGCFKEQNRIQKDVHSNKKENKIQENAMEKNDNGNKTSKLAVSPHSVSGRIEDPICSENEKSKQLQAKSSTHTDQSGPGLSSDDDVILEEVIKSPSAPNKSPKQTTPSNVKKSTTQHHYHENPEQHSSKSTGLSVVGETVANLGSDPDVQEIPQVPPGKNQPASLNNETVRQRKKAGRPRKHGPLSRYLAKKLQNQNKTTSNTGTSQQKEGEATKVVRSQKYDASAGLALDVESHPDELMQSLVQSLKNKPAVKNPCAANIDEDDVIVLDASGGEGDELEDNTTNKDDHHEQEMEIEEVSRVSDKMCKQVTTATRPNQGKIVQKKMLAGRDKVCNICSKVFETFHGMERHMIIHLHFKPFKCRFCGVRTSDSSCHVKHLRQRHKTIINKTLDFKCGLCGVNCNGPTPLLRHAICHTKNETNKKCKRGRPKKTKMLGSYIDQKTMKKGDLYQSQDSLLAKTTVKDTGNMEDLVMLDAPAPVGDSAVGVVEQRDYVEDAPTQSSHELDDLPECSKMFDCVQCDISCTDTFYYIDHIKTQHAPNLQFQCPLCTKVFKYEKCFVKHLSTGNCNDNESLQCTDCEYKATDLTDLSEHVMNIHTLCHVCQKEFTSLDNLQRHLVTHLQIKPFQCQKCIYKTSDTSCLIKHMKNNHEDNEVSYECYKCKTFFKGATELTRHIFNHVTLDDFEKAVTLPSVKHYQCGMCSFTCFEASKLSTHSKSCKAAVEVNAPIPGVKKMPDSNIRNPVCTSPLKGSINQSSTEPTVNPKKVFRCTKCNFISSDTNEHVQHVINKHNAKNIQYQCHICKVLFNTPVMLIKHIETHSSGKTTNGGSLASAKTTNLPITPFAISASKTVIDNAQPITVVSPTMPSVGNPTIHSVGSLKTYPVANPTVPSLGNATLTSACCPTMLTVGSSTTPSGTGVVNSDEMPIPLPVQGIEQHSAVNISSIMQNFASITQTSPPQNEPPPLGPITQTFNPILTQAKPSSTPSAIMPPLTNVAYSATLRTPHLGPPIASPPILSPVCSPLQTNSIGTTSQQQSSADQTIIIGTSSPTKGSLSNYTVMLPAPIVLPSPVSTSGESPSIGSITLPNIIAPAGANIRLRILAYKPVESVESTSTSTGVTSTTTTAVTQSNLVGTLNAVPHNSLLHSNDISLQSGSQLHPTGVPVPAQTTDTLQSLLEDNECDTKDSTTDPDTDDSSDEDRRFVRIKVEPQECDSEPKGEVFSCNLCQTEFVQASALLRHQILLHRIRPEDSQVVSPASETVDEGSDQAALDNSQRRDTPDLEDDDVGFHYVISDSEEEEETDTASETNSVSKRTKVIQATTNKNSKLKCPHCNRVYKNKDKLKRHLREQHVADMVDCRYEGCEKSFPKIASLRRHMLIHIGVKPYQCMECHSRLHVFHDSSAYVKHMRHHHKVKEVIYHCQYCSVTTSSPTVLLKHLEEHEEYRQLEQVYACQQCQCLVKTLADLQAHTETKHDSSLSRYCWFCPSSFSCVSLLIEHLFTHLPHPRFQCKLCGFVASETSMYDSHMKGIHGCSAVMLYHCPKCATVFHSGTNLLKHELEHTSHGLTLNTLFKSFTEIKEKSHVKQKKHGKHKHKKHKKKSEKEMPPASTPPVENNTYQCNICHLSLPTPYILRKHLWSHTDQKPFHCNECNYQTSNGSNFATHMKVNHQGVPATFVCFECRNSFQKASELLLHLEAMHPLTFFSCSKCNKCFRSTTELNIHIGSQHLTERLDCRFCGKLFMKHFQILRHEKTHTRPYVCPKRWCLQRFSENIPMINHRQAVHKGNWCTHCHTKFPRLSEKTQHEKMHIEEITYSCVACKKTFKAFADLVLHTDIFLENYPNMTCKTCNIGLNLPCEMLLHEEMHNKLESHIRCQFCHTVISNIHLFLKHQQDLHGITLMQDSNELTLHSTVGETMLESILVKTTTAIKCPYDYCSQNFGNSSVAKSHLTLDHNIPNHVADKLLMDLNQKFGDGDCDSQQKKEEMADVNKNDDDDIDDTDDLHRLTCKFCSAKFSDRALLKSHEVAHSASEGQPFPAASSSNVHECKYCGFTFKTESELIEHKKLHISLQPTGVDISEPTINFTDEDTKQNLVDKDEQYACPFCNMKSSSKQSLMKHIMSHAGQNVSHGGKLNVKVQMSFKCDFCSASFQYREMLTKHKKKHSSEVGLIYKCSFCSKEFNHIAKYYRHKMVAHSGESNAGIKRPVGRPRKYPKVPEFKKTLPVGNEKKVENQLNPIASTKEDITKCSVQKETETIEIAAKDPTLSFGRYSCKYCDKKFRKKKRLNCHIESHKKEVSYVDKTFKDLPTDVKQEKTLVNSGVSSSSSIARGWIYPHKCQECNALFRKKRALVRHQLHIHGNKKALGRISQIFSGAIKLKLRSNSDRTVSLKRKSNSVTVVKKWRCISCGERFLKEVTLLRHLATHKDKIERELSKESNSTYLRESRSNKSASKLDTSLKEKRNLPVSENVQNLTKDMAVKKEVRNTDKGLSQSVDVKKSLTLPVVAKLPKDELNTIKKPAEDAPVWIYPYNCEFCDGKFSKRQIFDRHLRKHRNKQRKMEREMSKETKSVDSDSSAVSLKDQEKDINSPIENKKRFRERPKRCQEKMEYPSANTLVTTVANSNTQLKRPVGRLTRSNTTTSRARGGVSHDKISTKVSSKSYKEKRHVGCPRNLRNNSTNLDKNCASQRTMIPDLLDQKECTPVKPKLSALSMKLGTLDTGKGGLIGIKDEKGDSRSEEQGLGSGKMQEVVAGEKPQNYDAIVADKKQVNSSNVACNAVRNNNQPKDPMPYGNSYREIKEESAPFDCDNQESMNVDCNATIKDMHVTSNVPCVDGSPIEHADEQEPGSSYHEAKDDKVHVGCHIKDKIDVDYNASVNKDQLDSSDMACVDSVNVEQYNNQALFESGNQETRQVNLDYDIEDNVAADSDAMSKDLLNSSNMVCDADMNTNQLNVQGPSGNNYQEPTKDNVHFDGDMQRSMDVDSDATIEDENDHAS